jgi:hypothetical protein
MQRKIKPSANRVDARHDESSEEEEEEEEEDGDSDSDSGSE